MEIFLLTLLQTSPNSFTKRAKGVGGRRHLILNVQKESKCFPLHYNFRGKLHGLIYINQKMSEMPKCSTFSSPSKRYRGSYSTGISNKIIDLQYRQGRSKFIIQTWGCVFLFGVRIKILTPLVKVQQSQLKILGCHHPNTSQVFHKNKDEFVVSSPKGNQFSELQ